MSVFTFILPIRTQMDVLLAKTDRECLNGSISFYAHSIAKTNTEA